MDVPKARRPWTLRLAVAGALLAPAIPARAESASAGDADAVTERPKTPEPRSWAAAVGVVASVGPEYAGGDRVSTNLEPGFALRWGRVSFASRSAFAVRSSDPGARGGLRVELAQGERFRAGLGLRADGGRRESASDRLAGMGDVRGTVRARLSASYRLDGGWRLGSAVMVDALRRGTGTLVDGNLSHTRRLTDRTTLGTALSVTGGDSTYLRAYFGVTPEQAQRSGYAVYEPGAGVRDISLSIGTRTELSPAWAVFTGASASRLVSAAARSPLTFQRTGWSLSAGVVYRF
jgi:outer membrane scaffolding protein for murein synthesis (MipA/OmpV family)